MTSQPKALIAVAPEPRELIDRALRFVAQRGWSGPDGGFLLALARFVSDLLDVEYVLIDRLAEAPECAETVAFCARERQLPNAIYPLRDTPCENVFGKSMCIYPRGVAGLFPRDALLRDLGVESYAGLPLWSAAGEPIGLIAVMDVKPLPDDDAVAAVLQIVAARAAYELESQRAEEERRAHLRFLECLDQVDAAMRGVTDLGQMLGRALDVVLAAFACDRVSLVYPCDPDAPTCVCPMERVRPEYPGVFQVGAELPVDEDIARGFRVAAESIDPVQFGPGGRYPVAGKVAERHGIQAVLLMALRPRIGKPWLLCLNQCSHPRVWTRAEERLFQEIGRRLADGLTGLLAYRDVQQSERLFRSVAEHSPDLISRVDRDGRYVYISPIVRRFTGLPPEAFIGQPIGASRVAAGHVTDLDGLRQLKAAVRAVFETGQQQRCEIAMDGGVGGLFSDYVLVPERDDDGRIVSALCIARDTTERRRNEDVQKKLNRSLRLLSDFNQMLVHAQSARQLLDSGCRIVVESGGYAYASIRLAAPQAPQDGATFIAHGRQAAYGDPRIEGILRDVAPGVEPAGDVRLWRRPDRPRAGAPPASRGEPAAPASCVALALRHAEQDLGVLHILSDDEAAFPPEEIELLRELASDLAFGLVALRARAAEIAREAALAEAVRVARQRSQFIAQMSHELRTPLNAILGCAQLLDHAPDEAVRRRRLVKILLDSGDHLLALIEDILDLARIDAGKLELRAVPIRLDEFFESVSEISRVKAEEKHLQFRLALAPGLPVAVAADGKRLRQVLLNLLSNSVKFTDSGAVSLRVSRVGADTPAPGAARHVARLRFEIEDTGVGMNEEQSSRLFQPFEQVGDSARRQGGAGLGLAISLPLIRLMGGDIQVRSAIGRGSTFSFELDFPVCDDAA